MQIEGFSASETTNTISVLMYNIDSIFFNTHINVYIYIYRIFRTKSAVFKSSIFCFRSNFAQAAVSCKFIFPQNFGNVKKYFEKWQTGLLFQIRLFAHSVDYMSTLLLSLDRERVEAARNFQKITKVFIMCLHRVRGGSGNFLMENFSIFKGTIKMESLDDANSCFSSDYADYSLQDSAAHVPRTWFISARVRRQFFVS